MNYIYNESIYRYFSIVDSNLSPNAHKPSLSGDAKSEEPK
jgi:hypothetical protein